ncbi:hypothetical protein CNMCM5793_005829 [Aspergillus hiratsukae]|uniref:Uncharacterized protein n=1 Tax=Aspergillus hiratsukae TaxID=1194566 RepID=A0A8H6UZC0_9EURO|nr:hypothetical protein CNMCM5793_005829 [Aspergillus hiratsukae]KAF7172317.1 hypothetical protein CNMCM6106_006559 [Aspergillus hiratsukae]
MVEVQTLTQPDIQYHPDHEKYLARVRRKATEDLPKSLPPGLPEKLSSPLVWKGKDIEKQDNWIYKLNDSQREEIHTELNSFKGEYADLVYGMP